MARDGSLEDRSTLKPDRNNFGPRLGLAFTPGDRTVIRGGYGVSYVHFHRAGGANVLPINGPQVINAVVVQTPAESTFRTTQQGYPAGLTDPTRFNPLLANITYMPSDYRSSDVHSWLRSSMPGLCRRTVSLSTSGRIAGSRSSGPRSGVVWKTWSTRARRPWLSSALDPKYVIT